MGDFGRFSFNVYKTWGYSVYILLVQALVVRACQGVGPFCLSYLILLAQSFAIFRYYPYSVHVIIFYIAICYFVFFSSYHN